MFQVLDNGKPADSESYPILKEDCWKNSKFKTFDEAVEYANLWVFPIIFSDLKSMGFIKIELNTPISMGGVIMEIREIE